MDHESQALASRFAEGAQEFAACPLYRQLCLTVAADERLLQIASQRRAGQQPTNLLLAAVQYLLFEDPADELARWYVSIDGARARPPETAGPAFTAFCLRRRDALVDLLREKLVQTNVVKRAAALRLGLAHVALHADGPITLIELGASAGVLLAFDRYRYRLAGGTWGAPDSTLEIAIDWLGDADRLPDLDRLPTIARRFGIDLAPIDARDAIARRWLRALVWPGNENEWLLLERALDLIADDPPRVLPGDAIEVLGRWASTNLAPGGPIVVFHAATRAHLTITRREAFDRAIRQLGRGRHLFWLQLESTPEPLAGSPGALVPAHLLQLIEVDGDREETQRLAIFESHAEWAMPLEVI
jgi:hypothetical protein